MSAPFTADQLESLSAQIDQQLAELQGQPSTGLSVRNLKPTDFQSVSRLV